MSCPRFRTGTRGRHGFKRADQVTVANARAFVQTCFRRAPTNDNNDHDDARIPTANAVAKAMDAVNRLDQMVEQVKQQPNHNPAETNSSTDNAPSRIAPQTLPTTKVEEEEVTSISMDELEESMERADQWALEWIAKSGIDWLPPIPPPVDPTATKNDNDDNVNDTPDEEEEEEDPPVADKPESSSSLVTLPLFPLSGTLFQPGRYLELFSSQTYVESPLPGDTNVRLQIFEPRYRSLYQDLLLQSTNQQERHVVVPFAHPCVPAQYASVALLYQVTDVQEVADQTLGEFQFVCHHSIQAQPIHLSSIVNPDAYHSKETYLQVQSASQDSSSLVTTEPFNQTKTTHKDDFPQVVQALESMIQTTRSPHGLAAKALHALQVQGIWGFVRLWCSGLQERLLQLELKLAAQVMQLERRPSNHKKNKNNNNDEEDVEQFQQVKSHILQVQHAHRQTLLSLKLESTLTLPRLLQHSSQDMWEIILLELIESEQSRNNPFSRP